MGATKQEGGGGASEASPPPPKKRVVEGGGGRGHNKFHPISRGWGDAKCLDLLFSHFVAPLPYP